MEYLYISCENVKLTSLATVQFADRVEWYTCTLWIDSLSDNHGHRLAKGVD